MIEVISQNDTVTISRAEYDELKKREELCCRLRDLIDECTKYFGYCDNHMAVDNDDRFYFGVKIVDSELYYAIKARLDSEQAEKETLSSIKEEEVE